MPPRIANIFLFNRPGLAGAIAFCAILSLSGCAGGMADRLQTAQTVSAGAGMTPGTIAASPFALTVYERIRQPGIAATLYIEGDGFAWEDRHTPSSDPTPHNPVGLRLAAADPGPNVIYLARPCEYSGMLDGSACDQKYWTGARLAPEVIAALDSAMDQLKGRYKISAFNLVGFSGGGGAVVLLAARRTDVASIRTVAGNVNQALFSQIHDVSPLSASLDPIDAARAVARIPQIHFAGEDDTVVPPQIADSFRAASSNAPCIKVEPVAGVRHDASWAAVWPQLEREPLPCR
jgi:hypothetical protein